MTAPPPPSGAPSSGARTMRGAARTLHDILDQLSSEAAQVSPPDDDANKLSDAQTSGEDKAKLGDLIDRLDERAFGLLILLLALPCCLPFVYVLPQIVALPMLALAGQLAAGRHHPWLPHKLHERRFSLPAFKQVVTRSEKYLGWIERLARPRLAPVTGRLGVRLVGLLMLVPTASILIPLPSTNTIPGIGVAIAALGLVERDGVLVIGGLLVGFIWVALLMFVGLEAAQIIKHWLSARL